MHSLHGHMAHVHQVHCNPIQPFTNRLEVGVKRVVGCERQSPAAHSVECFLQQSKEPSSTYNTPDVCLNKDAASASKSSAARRHRRESAAQSRRHRPFGPWNTHLTPQVLKHSAVHSSDCWPRVNTRQEGAAPEITTNQKTQYRPQCAHTGVFSLRTFHYFT